MGALSAYAMTPRPKAAGFDAPARDRLKLAATEDLDFYTRQFAPQTSELRRIGLGFGAGNQYEAIQNALPEAGRKFDAGAATFERDLERGGVRDDDAVASQRKRLSLARILSQVDSANRASGVARQNRQAAQEFGLDTYGSSASSAGSLLSAIASGDANRDLQYKDAKAGASAGKKQAIGTGLALAAALLI